jgi:hypothetical protein
MILRYYHVTNSRTAHAQGFYGLMNLSTILPYSHTFLPLPSSTDGAWYNAPHTTWWPPRRAMGFTKSNIIIIYEYRNPGRGTLGVVRLVHRLSQDYGKERVVSHFLHVLQEGSYTVRSLSIINRFTGTKNL